MNRKKTLTVISKESNNKTVKDFSMKKQTTAFFALALLVLTAFTAHAQTESDFTVTLTDDGTGARITRYNGRTTQVVIPATIQGMPVREIGSLEDQYYTAPFASKNITGVVIPDGVTLIGDYAFSSCSQLSSVTIPDSVTQIGFMAFNCRSLRSITLPVSVTAMGDSVFFGSGLTSIDLPASLTEIPDRTFKGCENLASVTIPEGVVRIGKEAFWETALTTVALPSTILQIDTMAFSDCSNLTTVTIPDSVEKIEFGGDVFYSCPKLNLASQAALRRLGYTGSF